MAGGSKVVKEYCPDCELWVEPFLEYNIGFCPYCGGTTKDLVNSVQTGPDFMDAPDTRPSKIVRYSR